MVLEHGADALCCVLVYENEARAPDNQLHFPTLLKIAKRYCAKSPQTRKIFPAEDFQREFPEDFTKIVKDTLNMSLSLESTETRSVKGTKKRS